MVVADNRRHKYAGYNVIYLLPIGTKMPSHRLLHKSYAGQRVK